GAGAVDDHDVGVDNRPAVRQANRADAVGGDDVAADVRTRLIADGIDPTEGIKSGFGKIAAAAGKDSLADVDVAHLLADEDWRVDALEDALGALAVGVGAKSGEDSADDEVAQALSGAG